jgi:hypothetical protein
MSLVRACVLSVVLVPALALAAADKQTYPGTTKSNPPPPGTSGSMLVDKTIPAYGVQNQVPHYTDSRANPLYLEIHQVLADVESQVMSGQAGRPVVEDPKKKSKEEAASPKKIGDARINELRSRLEELDARIVYRTYLEQWHIDNSFSDLSRATELLALTGDVSQATVEKVQGTKPKAQAEAAPVKAPAAKAPAAPAKAPEAPAKAPEAPAPAPEAPAPAPEAPAPAPAVEAPAPAPEAPAPAAEAPAAPTAPAEPPAVEPPPVEPPPADK